MEFPKGIFRQPRQYHSVGEQEYSVSKFILIKDNTDSIDHQVKNDGECPIIWIFDQDDNKKDEIQKSIMDLKPKETSRDFVFREFKNDHLNIDGELSEILNSPAPIIKALKKIKSMQLFNRKRTTSKDVTQKDIEIIYHNEYLNLADMVRKTSELLLDVFKEDCSANNTVRNNNTSIICEQYLEPEKRGSESSLVKSKSSELLLDVFKEDGSVNDMVRKNNKSIICEQYLDPEKKEVNVQNTDKMSQCTFVVSKLDIGIQLELDMNTKHMQTEPLKLFTYKNKLMQNSEYFILFDTMNKTQHTKIEPISKFKNSQTMTVRENGNGQEINNNFTTSDSTMVKWQDMPINNTVDKKEKLLDRDEIVCLLRTSEKESSVKSSIKDKSTQMFGQVTDNDLLTLDWIHYNIVKVKPYTFNADEQIICIDNVSNAVVTRCH